jgi:hypothetical protein
MIIVKVPVMSKNVISLILKSFTALFAWLIHKIDSSQSKAHLAFATGFSIRNHPVETRGKVNKLILMNLI